MKKFLIILLVCVMGASVVSAQQMKKGSSLVSVGLGFVPGIGGNVAYDYGLVDSWGPGIFTIGGFVGVETWKPYSYYRQTNWFFAPRATYRYPINKDFEVYGSVMLGITNLSYNYDDNYYSTGLKDNHMDVGFGTTVGCRYSFSSSLSVFAEVGWNVSYLNGGIAFSF